MAGAVGGREGVALTPSGDRCTCVEHCRCARIARMKNRVLILGAGFGGLELATVLSDALADEIDVTADRQGRQLHVRLREARRDVRRRAAGAARLPYAEVREAGHPGAAPDDHRDRSRGRRVTTGAGTHEADVLVIALGADYDLAATPGLAETGASSTRSTGPCAPATPSDASRRATSSSACAARRSSARRRPASARCCCTTSSSRAASARPARSRSCCRSARPVPPSPETSAALIEAFAERGIASHPGAQGERARRRAQRRRPGRRQSSCRTTSSSACRSTARPRSCRRAA